MSKQVIWTKVVLEEFVKVGNLTKEEEQIIRTRCAGWTITEQSVKLNMSRSKINNIIKILKIKYDEAQKYSCILPVRKSSAKELYMDTN